MNTEKLSRAEMANKDATSSEAIHKFNQDYLEIDNEIRIESAKKNLLTREVLLGHIKRTMKVVIETGHIEIRAKLSKKELDGFPNVKEWMKTGDSFFEGMTKAKKQKTEHEINEFFCYLIVNPSDLKPEDIDNAFTPPELTVIAAEWLSSQASGFSEEAIKFFR